MEIEFSKTLNHCNQYLINIVSIFFLLRFFKHDIFWGRFFKQTFTQLNMFQHLIRLDYIIFNFQIKGS
jgi:hypothetical protein